MVGKNLAMPTKTFVINEMTV